MWFVGFFFFKCTGSMRLFIHSFLIPFRFILCVCSYGLKYNGVCQENNSISNSFSRKEYPPQLQKVEADHIRLPRSQGVGKLCLEFSFLLSRIIFSIPALGRCIAKLCVSFSICLHRVTLVLRKFVPEGRVLPFLADFFATSSVRL